MSVTGYKYVEFAVPFYPSAKWWDADTLRYDYTVGRWTVDLLSRPQILDSEDLVYRCPLGKKILSADVFDRIGDSGSSYTAHVAAYLGDIPPDPEITDLWKYRDPDVRPDAYLGTGEPPQVLEYAYFYLIEADATSEIEV